MSAAEETPDVPVAEGDRVALEYHSVHAGRRIVVAGTVEEVTLKGAPDEDGEWEDMLAEIYVRPESEDHEREPHYAEDDKTPMRRVLYEIGSERGWHGVDGRNGFRWNNLSKAGTETTLTVLAEDEDVPHPSNEVLVAVEVRCKRCAGTSTLTVTETEPDFQDRGWACPHCHEAEADAAPTNEEQYEILGCKPTEEFVDALDSLADLEVAEWAASPTRWRAFTECVLKGRKATEYADEVDVTPGTVYRHVHDAREVIKGGHNE